RYTYDAAGNRLTDTDELNQTNTFTYDSLDRVATQTDALDGHTASTYDAAGNKGTETDENGHSVTYTYDALDRLTLAVDGAGYRSTVAYDAVGNVVQKTQQLDLTDPTRLAVTTEDYDALNRVSHTLTADGRLIAYTY